MYVESRDLVSEINKYNAIKINDMWILSPRFYRSLCSKTIIQNVIFYLPFSVNWPLELQYIHFQVTHMVPVLVCTKYSNFFQTFPEKKIKHNYIDCGTYVLPICFLQIRFKLFKVKMAKNSKQKMSPPTHTSRNTIYDFVLDTYFKGLRTGSCAIE